MAEATLYLHSSKESNYEIANQLKLRGKALDMFLFACHEVKVGLEVNKKTGEAKIVSIDGRKVQD